MSKQVLDRAASALLNMGAVTHKRPPKPTKKELARKFKMTTDQQGKAVIREAE